jgi:hypothetical protein
MLAVERMSEDRNVKNVYITEGKRCVGKSRKIWLDDVENEMKKMGVRGWRKMVRDIEAWKLIPQQARVLYGQQSQWGRKEEKKNSVSSRKCL